MHGDLWTIVQLGLETVPAEKLIPVLQSPKSFQMVLGNSVIHRSVSEPLTSDHSWMSFFISFLITMEGIQYFALLIFRKPGGEEAFTVGWSTSQ